MPTTYDCAFVLETLLVRARRAEWEAIAIATKRSYNQIQSAVYYPQRAMCFLWRSVQHKSSSRASKLLFFSFSLCFWLLFFLLLLFFNFFSIKKVLFCRGTQDKKVKNVHGYAESGSHRTECSIDWEQSIIIHFFFFFSFSCCCEKLSTTGGWPCVSLATVCNLYTLHNFCSFNARVCGKFKQKSIVLLLFARGRPHNCRLFVRECMREKKRVQPSNPKGNKVILQFYSLFIVHRPISSARQSSGPKQVKVHQSDLDAAVHFSSGVCWCVR